MVGAGGLGHPSGLPKTRVPCLACCQWTTSGSVPKSSVSEDPSTCPTALLRIKATSCKVRSVRPGPYRSRHQNCSRSSGFRSELLQPPLPSPPPPPATEKASPCEEHPIPGAGAGKAARWAPAGSLCWWSCQCRAAGSESQGSGPNVLTSVPVGAGHPRSLSRLGVLG